MSKNKIGIKCELSLKIVKRTLVNNVTLLDSEVVAHESDYANVNLSNNNFYDFTDNECNISKLKEIIKEISINLDEDRLEKILQIINCNKKRIVKEY